MDDAQAVRRLKDRDIGGLEELVARHQMQAVRTAFFITHDRPLAEDVVQETFLRIYLQIRSFDEKRPFEPYLMRSVVHAALNAMRRESRSGLPESEADAIALPGLLSRASAVEDNVEFAERKREILLALDHLSARQRAAILQRYYFGMSEREMAESMEAEPGTIKWLLHEARCRLRSVLRPERNAE